MGLFPAARLTAGKARLAGGIGLSVTAMVAAAIGMAAPAAAAQGQILGIGSPDVVKDSYVVVLKNSAQTDRAAAVQSSATSLTKQYGGNVKFTYHASVTGFAATMTEAQARKLAADPAIEYVQADKRITLSATTQPNPPSWGQDRVDQRTLPLDNSYTYTTDAANVNAYIIDTGIRLTHSDFGGRAKTGFDAVTSGGTANDCNGHGTHVSGTVGGKTYGLAKSVQLYAVRVLDCNGSGTTAQVVAGIDWVTANAKKPAVANMSLGGGVDTVLDDAVKRSIASGVTYGIASGNSSANACNYSPARVPEAITVNSTDSTDARSSFSNFGTCTDIFAPGGGITSAWNTSDTASNTISGTSMATPHVVGGAALYLAANPTATPQQVRDALVASATSDTVTSPGTGSPNKLLYTGSSGPPPPPPVTCVTKTNSTRVDIPDLSTVNSPISVTECAGKKASSSSKISVDIVHTYSGDLIVSIVSPTGTVTTLRSRTGGSTANIVETYTANLSAFDANGTWNLRVQDAAQLDTGYIKSWTLTV